MKRRLVFVLVILYAAGGLIPTVPAQPNRSVEIPVGEWLILGPFQFSGVTSGLGLPYLPEKEVSPSTGTSFGRFVWQKVQTADGSFDFTGMHFPVSTYCTLYAFTHVLSDQAGTARLLLGSDDGIAVFWNGMEVWRNDVQRGLTPKEDAVNVRLNKGWNRLLLKVSQTEGGWGLSCSIVSDARLKFSGENPNPGVMTGPGKTQKLHFVRAGFRKDPVSSKLVMQVFFFNPRDEKVADIPCTLSDSKGKPSAEAVLKSAAPFGIGRTDFVLDPALAARLWSEGAPRVNVSFPDQPLDFPLSEDLALRVLPLAAAGLQPSNAKIQTLLEKLEPALSMYSGSSVTLVPEARKALRACILGQPDRMAQSLQQITDRITAGIPDRSRDSVQVVGHAHIDMNWLWTWNETLKTGHDTFRQTVAFMDEFPDFTFIQSQAALHKAIEGREPELFERIKKYVREGRWEPAGGMWVEGDTDLSGGEALSRSFLLGQRYFLDRFAKTARVGWLPDNFGHVSQLPQLLKLAGCDYYYFHRCRPYLGTFWWEGPDGSKVLCYSNKTYNGKVTPDLTREIDDIVPDKHRLLEICGVGDHGGGPTRNDIESAHRLDKTPRFPSVRFTTAESFFRKAEREMAGRPTHRGEMQYTFEGCYTNVAKVKEGNRNCESALYTAEWFTSLRRLLGGTYPADDLRQTWETVLFNEFHDILPGSAIHESNADAAADHKWALSRAEAIRDAALRGLADEIQVPDRPGQPVMVFNLQPRKRKALVEAEIFTHEPPATARLAGWGDFYGSYRIHPVDIGQGAVPSVLVLDPAGKPVPAQIVWGKNFPPGWRFRVQFVAEDLPPGGYKTYSIDASKSGTANEPIPFRDGEFETDFFRIVMDMKTGDIVRLFDKRTGTELAAAAGGLNRLRVYLEASHDMNAWNIGPISRTEDVSQVEEVRVIAGGPVQACVEAVKTWGRSRFIQRTTVYRSYPRIDFELEAHWFEQGSPKTDSPMLRVVFPLSLKDARFQCHVPFDVVNRPTNGQEVPAQQWVDVTDGKNGIALLNQTKYGHSYENGELRLTLLRSAYHPDLYPDQGLHRIKYALYPHSGDWKNGVWSEGEGFNVPAVATEPPSAALGRSHATRPQEGSLVAIDPADVVLSGIKQSEDGNTMVFRLAEVNGSGTTARLTLPGAVQSAERLDLIERPMAGSPTPEIKDRIVTVALKPHEIVTLGIRTR